MKDGFLKRLVSGVLAILLLSYVGYQVYRLKHTEVRTETAEKYTASDLVQTTVVALRDETLLESSAKGVADYVVSSGEKVCKGEVIAKIYANSAQITAQHELDETDSAISQLEELQSPGNTYSLSIDTANSRILSETGKILAGIRTGEMTDAFSRKSALLTLLNQKQIAAGQVSDFSSRIAALKSQREALAAKTADPVGSVASPSSGYFIEVTDGMENAYDVSAAASISCSDIRSLLDRSLSADSGAVGKISADFNWYLVCIVPGEQLTGFRQLGADETVSVSFPFVSGVSVPATVAAINVSGENGEAAVVLHCRELNTALSGIRRETANICVNEYTGLRVSQKAIHYETIEKTVTDESGSKTVTAKEVEGVYVLHGSQISFRQIVPLFSTESYVVCSRNPDADSLMTDATVELYDEVVVEGTDLYDGKVVR